MEERPSDTMKICRYVCISILLLLLASGCSSVVPKELTLKRTSDSFCLVLVRSSDVPFIRLPVKIDSYTVNLSRSSFLELELPAGMHFISAKRGHFLSRYFAPASTNVGGSPGERRYFSYVVKLGTIDIIIPIYSGGSYATDSFDFPFTRPVQAEWKEISQQEFEHQFPHAKFNH